VKSLLIQCPALRIPFDTTKSLIRAYIKHKNDTKENANPHCTGRQLTIKSVKPHYRIFMHSIKIETLASRMQKYNNSTNPYLKLLFPDKIHKLQCTKSSFLSK
jgi:hypothetical protein